jgi:hypothetical protein
LDKPVALLIGDSSQELCHVTGAFVTALPEQTTVVRLQEPYSDVLDGMRAINRGLGFESNDLSIDDLRSILTMFLEHQSRYRRRTVLCIEQAEEQSLWLLDGIAELIACENTPHDGLMILLTGGPDLTARLRKSSFRILAEKAKQPIKLEPFTATETKEFVRLWSEASGLGEISSLFDLDALERLQKMSGGVPDTVGKLCRECVKLANPVENGPVTAKQVVKAARRLRLNSSADTALSVVRNPFLVGNGQFKESLIVRYNGALIEQIPLTCGRLLVGRAKFADICLPSSLVSRRHALLIRTADELQVLDLGSTNGTYVAGFRVTEHTVKPGTVITFGDCSIAYDVAGD